MKSYLFLILNFILLLLLIPTISSFKPSEFDFDYPSIEFDNNTAFVNRSDFWDNLDTPDDIFIGDLDTDGGLYMDLNDVISFAWGYTGIENLYSMQLEKYLYDISNNVVLDIGERTLSGIGGLMIDFKNLGHIDFFDNNLTTTGNITANLVTANISMNYLNSATYTTLQDWSDTTQSAGKISGGVFTSNGDGTVKVSAGTGIIKLIDSPIAPNYFFDWVENASVPLVDNATNYIYIDVNGGTPDIKATIIKSDANNRNKILLGKIFREGNDLHKAEAGMVITEATKRTLTYFTQVFGEVVRASGYLIAETGNRYLTTTNGVLFAGLTRLTTTAIDTSGAGVLEYYYRDAGAGWNEFEADTINNSHWDDGTGTLNTLTPNRYGVHWVYGDADGHLMVVYGQGDYTLAQAEAVQPPTTLPNHVAEFGFITAKIVVKEGETNLFEVESAYDIAFTPSGASVHNELSGLQGGSANEYYHWTFSDYTNRFLADGTIPMTSNLDMGTNNITNLSEIRNSVKSDVIPALSPEVYWKFEDDLLDSSGNGKTLSKIGGIEAYAIGIGIETKAIDLDGSTVYKATTYSPIENDDPRSVSVWFKTVSNNKMAIVDWGDVLADTRNSFGIWLEDSGDNSVITIVFGSESLVGTTEYLNDGEWHNVVVTYSGGLVTNNFIMYIDGVEETLGSVPAITLDTDSDDVAIGRSSTHNGFYFDGKIDEVAIFGDILTQEEVTSIYDSLSGKLNIISNVKITGDLVTLGANTAEDFLESSVVLDKEGTTALSHFTTTSEERTKDGEYDHENVDDDLIKVLVPLKEKVPEHYVKSVSKLVELMRDAIYEIKTWMGITDDRIEELETENQKIKDCTSSSKDFPEYKTCIAGMDIIF